MDEVLGANDATRPATVLRVLSKLEKSAALLPCYSAWCDVAISLFSRDAESISAAVDLSLRLLDPASGSALGALQSAACRLSSAAAGAAMTSLTGGNSSSVQLLLSVIRSAVDAVPLQPLAQTRDLCNATFAAVQAALSHGYSDQQMTVTALLKRFAERMAELPWADATIGDTDLAALCTGLFSLGKAAAVAENVPVLNLVWQNLRSFLQSGRDYLRSLFPFGSAAEFLETRLLEKLRAAVDRLGTNRLDEFKDPFTFARFYMRNLSFICKTFASSLTGADVKTFVDFYRNARECTPPCIAVTTIPDEIFADLRKHIADVLDSMLCCTFDSLYPASETVLFLKDLALVGKPITQLLSLAVCVKSKQAFTDGAAAEHVITQSIPAIFTLLPLCTNELCRDDVALSENVFQSLVFALESSASCAAVEGALFCINATLLGFALHNHPLPSAFAIRLWAHAFARGDVYYQRHSAESVIAALAEMNDMNVFVPVPRCMQLLHLLGVFCGMGGTDIRDLVLDRMLQPAVGTSVIGQWEPSPLASMLFFALPLARLVGSPSQRSFGWFLANFVAILRRSSPPSASLLTTIALCLRGIVRHPDLHSAILPTDTLSEAVDACAVILCSGKSLPASAIASLLGAVAAMLPYIKSAHLKPILSMLAQIAATPTPELEYSIAEFCGECACVPLDVLPAVSAVFHSLLSAATSNMSLCHSLRCFQTFASSCANESDVTAAVPAERMDDLEVFIGVEQEPQPQPSPAPTAASSSPTLAPPQLEEMSSLAAKLADSLSKLSVPAQQLPDSLRVQLSRLLAQLNAIRLPK